MVFVHREDWGLTGDSAADEKKSLKVSVTSFLTELSGVGMNVGSTGFVMAFNLFLGPSHLVKKCVLQVSLSAKLKFSLGFYLLIGKTML